jgi:benzoyl-CoA reductase/2-hydroxyglutaryl-CoA dehydratase subunit BcrC/BadD/HgdB
MAAAYTAVYPNRSREWKVRYLARQFERYGVDAAIFHDARTAPEHSAARSGIHIRLRRDTGVTPIVLEADTHDLRLVSVDHIRGQIREFVEQRRAAGVRRNGHRDHAPGAPQPAPAGRGDAAAAH